MSRSDVLCLRAALEESHRQAERARLPGFPCEALETLQAFQRRRLADTYADLVSQPPYAAATRFFLDELYGGKDASERDEQVLGAFPIMERTLPGRLQATLADAFRLQGLSLKLDIMLAEGLAEQGGGTLDTGRYAALYPRVPRAERETQIDLIERLAGELDRVVHLPLVLGLVVAMRGPARAAGFKALQAFLERGLRAFRAMGNADEFTRIIVRRERMIMDQLYAGSDKPFKLDDGD